MRNLIKIHHLFFLMIIKTAGAQTSIPDKKDLEAMNRIRKVAFVEESKYSAKDKFGEVVKDTIVDRHFYTFELNKLKILRREYLSKDSIEKTTNIEFNENKDIAKVTHKSKYKDVLMTFKYNKNKQPIEIKWLQSDTLKNLYVFKYDTKNNVIEDGTYDHKGNFWKKTIYDYNENGDKIKETIYTGNIYEIFEYKTFEYSLDRKTTKTKYYSTSGNLYLFEENKRNNKEQLVEKIYHYSDGDVKHFYKYDENNNQIEESRKYKDGDISLIEKINYTYDQNGNWIKKIIFDGHKPTTLIEREIKYYP